MSASPQQARTLAVWTVAGTRPALGQPASRPDLICLGALLVLTALLPARTGQASGFMTARFGGEHGHAASDDPSSLYYNPGALGLIQDTRISLEGIVALRNAQFERASSDQPEPEGAEGANVGRSSLRNVLGGPALFAATRLGDLSLAAGLFAPFGGQNAWDPNPDFEGDPDFPGAVDGVARWHIISGRMASIYGSLGAAWSWPDAGLSLGLSGSLVHTSLSTLRARNAFGTDDISREGRPLEGRSLIEVDGLHGAFGAGLSWEAAPGSLWLGASYQSRPGLQDLVLEGTMETTLPGVTSSPTPIDLHMGLPDVLRTALRYRPSKGWEMRLFGDYTRWSVHERNCASGEGRSCEVQPDGAPVEGANVLQNQERRWRDAFGVRAGLSHWTRPWLELFAGAGYDGNAVPASTLDPSMMDGHDLSGSAGTRLMLPAGMGLALSYTQMVFLPRDTRGESELAALAAPSSVPGAGGRYEQWAGLVFAQLSVAL